MEHLKQFISLMRKDMPFTHLLPGGYRVYEDEEIKAQMEVEDSNSQTLLIYTKGPLGSKLVFVSSRQGMHQYEKGIWEDRIKELVQLGRGNAVSLETANDKMTRTKQLLSDSSPKMPEPPRPAVIEVAPKPNSEIPIFPEPPIFPKEIEFPTLENALHGYKEAEAEKENSDFSTPNSPSPGFKPRIVSQEVNKGRK